MLSFFYAINIIAEVEYALASIDKRMVIDLCEQYARPIDVPFKKTKVRTCNVFFEACLMPMPAHGTLHVISFSQGVKVITLKGMESVQRSRVNPVDEHCAVFDCHTQKAADLINKLFS